MRREMIESRLSCDQSYSCILVLLKGNEIYDIICLCPITGSFDGCNKILGVLIVLHGPEEMKTTQNST